jgi:hypothetical protein
MKKLDLWLLFIFILNIFSSYYANETLASIAWLCAFMVQLRIVLQMDSEE